MGGRVACVSPLFHRRLFMSDHIVSDAQLWKAIGAATKGAAALVIATGILWGAIWWAIQPRIDTYFDGKIDELRTEFSGFAIQLSRIENALPAPRRFVEFASGGRLPDERLYEAGSTAVFLYQLRRNKSCPTTVRAQFWSYEQNSIASEYSYDTAANQAPTTVSFNLFSVRVRLPEGMEEGHYSYVPVLIPDSRSCPSEEPVQVPPSDFFTVSNP